MLGRGEAWKSGHFGGLVKMQRVKYFPENFFICSVQLTARLSQTRRQRWKGRAHHKNSTTKPDTKNPTEQCWGVGKLGKAAICELVKMLRVKYFPENFFF